MENDYIFECKGISKTFGGTHALKHVQLHVRRGEVHALLGENGAGKSTLMNIIVGLLKPDEGTMTFGGGPYSATGPADAIQCGISMIHQELNPEPHLTVAESIFLKREDTKGKFPFLDKKKTSEKAAKVLKEYNVNLNPRMLVEKLTLAQVQMIEIIKAVSCDARMIIMDEPTSSLDNNETAKLFETIHNLKEKGVSIIYISHRMDEIFEICDSVSVFRDGEFVKTGPLSEFTREQLISLMVGKNVENLFQKVDCKIGDTVFKVENLCGNGFHDISFEVHAGEILGLTGLVGSGRSETMRAIFGLDPLTSGAMYLNGQKITVKNPRNAIKLGICMVNEDRKNFGLCSVRSIKENISLPSLSFRQKRFLIDQVREKKEVGQYFRQLGVKAASLEADAYSMSGGNQQKVVLAKWVMSNPKLLIMDEPTRGVDVGAKSEIYSLMCSFAAEGMAIIMISSELPEVMSMSDRILVFHEGKTNGEFTHAEVARGNITQAVILGKEFGE